METIQAFAQHPSMERSCLRFAIYEDKEVAKAQAERAVPAMYTDKSNEMESLV